MEARTAGASGQRLSLLRHPASTGEAASRVEVTAWRPQHRHLALLYVIHAPADELKTPPITESIRVDNLWRHTCLEAFIRPPTGEVYYELNLSPSTRWAAYGFNGYRAEMAEIDIPPPQIESRAYPDRHELEALVDLSALPALARCDWRLGLTAVVEDADGALAWWALTHPSEQGDFHNVASHVFDLPAVEPA